jgi:hypothetical protein
MKSGEQVRVDRLLRCAMFAYLALGGDFEISAEPEPLSHNQSMTATQ